MAALDRLGWAVGLGFTSHGVKVGIRTNQPSALARLAQVAPPGARPTHAPIVDHLYSVKVGGVGSRRGLKLLHLLYSDSTRVARSLSFDAILARLESDIALRVATRSPTRVFVHAGVVGWGGRAILLPGASGSGKTTLVAALLAAGATYYSDEFAVLDRRGFVHPYPRPLAVRHDDGAVERLAASDLGSRDGRRPLAVGWVVETRYSPRGRWRPRAQADGKAVLGMLAHGVGARSRPQVNLETLRAVVSSARVLKGPRGEADETAPALLARCNADLSRGLE